MGALEGRVAIITGAGGGIGREHALLFGREGAKVVVNDLGSTTDGTGADKSAAEAVAEEIRSAGGEATANADDVADWEGAGRLVDHAVSTFGHLDVLVNNAGILRDGFLSGMSVQDWDAVVRVHLRGHFCTMRRAIDHWRARVKAGEQIDASVIGTMSASGTTWMNPGQANYGASKAAIAALCLVAAEELARYGVRVNVIAPGARTRMTTAVAGFADMIAPPEDESAFDPYHPGNVSPLVAWLATANCDVTGRAFHAGTGRIGELGGWRELSSVSLDHRPTIEEVGRILAREAVV